MTSTVRRFQIAGVIGFAAATIFVVGGCANNQEPQKSVATVADAGSSDGPAPAASGGSRGGDPVAYSKCMRDNGVPNFPDPDKNGQIRLDPNSAVDQDSAEFRKAQDACKQYMGSAAKVKDDAGSQWTIADKLKYTDCMRKNGLPSMPDPDKNGQVVLPRSIDPESAVFKSAEAACKQYTPQNMPRGGGAQGGGS
jgi:hypothetical protein